MHPKGRRRDTLLDQQQLRLVKGTPDQWHPPVPLLALLLRAEAASREQAWLNQRRRLARHPLRLHPSHR